MTLMNRHPRTLQFALILFILLVLPFQTTVLGKKRQANKTRRSATHAEKGKKLSAKERRQGRRHERLSARQSRRGGKSRLSRRELRRERNLSAREQAAELKALERKIGRASCRERV